MVDLGIDMDDVKTMCMELVAEDRRVGPVSDDGERLSTVEQSQESPANVREAYRTAHNHMSPEEIVRIRSGYGAGQKPFGLVLGLGEATINGYESGELPTTASSNLIRTAADPAVFARLFERAREVIGPTHLSANASPPL